MLDWSIMEKAFKHFGSSSTFLAASWASSRLFQKTTSSQRPSVPFSNFLLMYPSWDESSPIIPSIASRNSFSFVLAAVELAAASGGIALLLGKIARRLTGSGRLIVPLDISLPSVRTHYLLQGDSASLGKPATQRVEMWLRQLFA